VSQQRASAPWIKPTIPRCQLRMSYPNFIAASRTLQRRNQPSEHWRNLVQPYLADHRRCGTAAAPLPYYQSSSRRYQVVHTLFSNCFSLLNVYLLCSHYATSFFLFSYTLFENSNVLYLNYSRMLVITFVLWSRNFLLGYFLPTLARKQYWTAEIPK